MNSTTRDGVLRGSRAALIRLLILGAAGISTYLLTISLTNGQVAGCGPESGCNAVLQSRWAYFLGIPVSALALMVDVGVLLTTFGCGPRSSVKSRSGAWEILLPGAMMIFGSALWFTALQAFVLHRYCPWCLTAHACGATAAVLLLQRLPVVERKSEKVAGVARAAVGKLAGAGLFGVAVLGVAQLLVAPKTYTVTTIPANPVAGTNATLVVTLPAATGTSNAVKSAGADPGAGQNPSPAPAVPPPPFFAVGNQVPLDLTQVPVWGPLSAPAKLVSLYDYTCHHCREMHERIVEVKKSFGDKLAVVSLPVPLDAQCNQYVRRTAPSHVNACVYARLGLIVWRAKRSALEAFDDWLFTGQNPPSLVEVTNKAVEMVGAEAFAKASQDPWVEEQVKTDIHIYFTSYQQYRSGNMPQFIIGTNIATGVMPTDKLRALVEPYVK